MFFIEMNSPRYLNLFKIALPLPGISSILHRLSAVAIFVLWNLSFGFIRKSLCKSNCFYWKILFWERISIFALFPVKQEYKKTDWIFSELNNIFGNNDVTIFQGNIYKIHYPSHNQEIHKVFEHPCCHRMFLDQFWMHLEVLQKIDNGLTDLSQYFYFWTLIGTKDCFFEHLSLFKNSLFVRLDKFDLDW